MNGRTARIRKKHLWILFITFLISIMLLCSPLLMTAEADAPGKGDTYMAGYSYREGSGLRMALGSTVWLPQLHLELYSGSSYYEYEVTVNDVVVRSGDFSNNSWAELDIELPEKRVYMEVMIGPHTYDFKIVVTGNLAESKEIDDKPPLVEMPKFELSKIKWIHVLYGIFGVGVGAGPIALGIHKYKKSEKWGDLEA